MYCPHCGEYYEDGSLYCASCKKPVDTANPLAATAVRLPKERNCWWIVGSYFVVIWCILFLMTWPIDHNQGDPSQVSVLASMLGIASLGALISAVLAGIIVGVKRPAMEEIYPLWLKAKLEKKIRIIAVFGWMLADIIFFGHFYVGYPERKINPHIALIGLEAVLIACVSYGVYRRSRVYALLLFGYVLISNFLYVLAVQDGMFPTILFGIPAWFGVVWTFAFAANERMIRTARERQTGENTPAQSQV